MCFSCILPLRELERVAKISSFTTDSMAYVITKLDQVDFVSPAVEASVPQTLLTSFHYRVVANIVEYRKICVASYVDAQKTIGKETFHCNFEDTFTFNDWGLGLVDCMPPWRYFLRIFPQIKIPGADKDWWEMAPRETGSWTLLYHPLREAGI